MWILCECGEFVDKNTFKDYIQTSINPSTSTIGHTNCGLIFDFIDKEMPKKYSSKKELKTIAMKFAAKCHMSDEVAGLFLSRVDALKSEGGLCDAEVVRKAFKSVSLD